jgi:putative Mg2+ transporter-C (MgtC) family protein
MDYEILLRFLLAALWGGIVGAEREYRSKPAGFRTMIMISIGSCFFTMMSAEIGGINNPDRIASNIVTGIGFLGAGVIFRGDNRVNGITTAATIWAVAAVGMGIAGGHYFASGCASLLVVIVLAILPFFEKVIDKLNQSKTYTIQGDYSGNIQSKIETAFKMCNLKFKLVKQTKEANDISMLWHAEGAAKQHERFITAMMEDIGIKKFEY